MKQNDLLCELKVECPFLNLFQEKEYIKGTLQGYRRKIVHIRADYDGGKWWNTIWPMHDELATLDIRKEIDSVYEALIAKDAFEDLNTMRKFCEKFPHARVHKDVGDEYNFYLVGTLCYYWLCCITRNKDYNLYLHAFLKRIEST